MQSSVPTNNANSLRSAIDFIRFNLEEPQLFPVPKRKTLASTMVRTRGSASAGDAGETQNPDMHSIYGAAAMPVYREDTPSDNENDNDDDNDDGDEEALQYSSEYTTSYNVRQSGVEYSSAEERQPPSPMVTPPTRSGNAATPHGPGTIKSTPISSSGVPHVYHDYSQVPDEANYVRKKTGGVSELAYLSVSVPE